MTSLAAGAPDAMPLVVRSTAVPNPGPLLSLLPELGPLAWVRQGQGLVGWGCAARVETGGAGRFADAEAWWRAVVTTAVVRDEVRLPGSGLVTFGSFAFADEPGGSALVVPEVAVGRRGDTWWVTTIGQGTLPGTPDLQAHRPAEPPQDVVFTDGSRSGTEWESVVADAVRRISAGGLEKVVLARDLVAESASDIDVRWPLQNLAHHYPSCWTFHVDGLFGATPEMLVRRERGLVTSRVLAGTIRPTGDDDHDLALAGSLARSSKDLEEHEYAVRSVADSLAPHCSSMNVPETPFVLHLPNVMHLATDVTGVMHRPQETGARTNGAAPAATTGPPTEPTTTALGLAAALHPSAAVGGTPTADAVALIAEVEGMDRGRYAGPVGWMDAAGDGEWGIALRCGKVEGARVRLFAGCGIVADSDPEAELAESQAKLVPVRDSLEC